jgi:hypothetical protein
VTLDEAIEHLGMRDATPDGGCCDEAKLAVLDAIGRVREVCTGRCELDHSRGWMVSAVEVLAALDGDGRG